MKRLLSILLLLCMCLWMSSCKNISVQQGTQDGEQQEESKTDVASTDEEMFTDRDQSADYDEKNAVKISLLGDTATCASDAVTVSGSTVTITDEGTYILSGTLDNGMIVVRADETDKPQLVLDGATVHSDTCAPLYILEADKVVVTLAHGSENTLSCGDSFVAIDENNIDAAIFSKQDLTLNGTGSLTVTSPAGHGIVSKDDLVLTGGNYTVTAASHGLDANDSIRIKGVLLTVDAGKDGIHAENTEDTALGFVYIADGNFQIEAEGDGISASAHMQINEGTYDILTGGGSENAASQTSDNWGGFMGGGMGMGGGRGDRGGAAANMSFYTTTATETTEDSSTSIKGLKSTASMLIAAGTFSIDAADDAVHSNRSITVSGGTFTIETGDDGFHADETLTITEGTITVKESYEGLEALDLAVLGGKIHLTASDDGLNAAGGTDSSGLGGFRGNEQFGGMGGNPPDGMGGSSDGSITISGGELYVNASGDGLDANGTLTITGGSTTVCGPTQGDTATMDYDVSGEITGGTFIGTGASGMAQTFSSSEQGVISVSVGQQSAQTEITLQDQAGNTLITYAPELAFSVVIISTPQMVTGETYTITVGSQSAEFTAD